MKKLNYLLILAGIIGVASAIVVTPDVASRYFSLDQDIAARALYKLQIYRLIAGGSGVALLAVGATLTLLGWSSVSLLASLGRMAENLEYSELLVLPFALMSATLIILSTSRYGAGLSSDSVNYISAARSIAAGHRPLRFDGSPFVSWPPAYPALLAILDWSFGVDALVSAGIVNAGIVVLTVCLSGRLMRRSHISPPLAYLGVLLVSFSVPLYHVAVMAWSEPLFICLTCLYLLNLKCYVDNDSQIAFLTAAGCAALASLTRYIGITLIFTGVITVLLLDRNQVRHKLARAILFSGLSALPTATWVVRNYMLTGTLVGPRATSSYGLLSNLSLTGRGMTTFFVYYRLLLGVLRYPLTYKFIAVAVSIGGIYLLWLALAAHRGTPVKWLKQALARNWPSVILLFTYTAFLVYSSTTTAFDPIDHRLLSPNYVPLVLLILSILQAVHDQAKNQVVSRGAVILVLLAMSIWPAAHVTSSTIVKMRFGAGDYNSLAWRESPTLEYLRQWEPADLVLYSNRPAAIYILANRQARRSPRWTYYQSRAVLNDPERLRGAWPEEPVAYLVHFDGPGIEHLFSLDQLSEMAVIAPFKRLDDATIYLVQRSDPQ